MATTVDPVATGAAVDHAVHDARGPPSRERSRGRLLELAGGVGAQLEGEPVRWRAGGGRPEPCDNPDHVLEEVANGPLLTGRGSSVLGGLDIGDDAMRVLKGLVERGDEIHGRAPICVRWSLHSFTGVGTAQAIGGGR